MYTTIKDYLKESKSNSYIYHGTHKGAAMNIQRDGFMKPNNTGEEKPSISFSNDIEYAKYYAKAKGSSDKMVLLRTPLTSDFIISPKIKNNKGDEYVTFDKLSTDNLEVQTKTGQWKPLTKWNVIFDEPLTENLSNSNYMLGKVKYSWVKNEIATVSRVEPHDTTRITILSERKKELKLDEYQNLYDYWNFCDKNSGSFKIANNPVEAYKRVVKEWVWYLTICQLFPDELKNAKRDFYTVMYDEITSLPKLSGELETDKIILEKAVRQFFMKPESLTRQAITAYDIYFNSLF